MTNKTGPLLVALAAILWGFDGVFRRDLYSLLPISIVFFEHLVGSLLILPFVLEFSQYKKIKKNEWLAIFTVSLLSGLLGTLWFTTALVKVEFIPFSVVILLQKLQPIFAIIAAKILLKEKLPQDFIKWTALAILAGYFLTFKNGRVDIHNAAQTIYAALFACAAAFAWGTSTAISRFALKNHSNTTITGLRFFLTTVFAGIYLVYLQGSQLLTQLPTQNQLLTLLTIAFSTGFASLWIYYKGLKQTQAKVAAVVELLFPLTGILIDIFLYQTHLALTQYIGGAILIYAIINVAKNNHS